MSNSNQKGITLVEILIALVIFVFVIIISYNMYLSMSESTARSNQKAKTIQNARTALDILSQELSMIGFGVDDSVNPKQRKICWADAYQIVFNADLDAGQADARGAINTSVYPHYLPPTGSTQLYHPGMTYTTGAETIRYTLDATWGSLVTSSDHENAYWASVGETQNQTENNNTYILFREVWGYNASSTPLNGGAKEPVANGLKAFGSSTDMYPNGDYPAPLFQYWGYFDTDPEEDLWADTDGDGRLSNSEIAAWLQPVYDASHRRVQYSETSTDTNGNGQIDTCLDDVLTRIVVTVTAESDVRDVKFPNLPRSDANGNNRIDAGETPYFFHDVVLSASVYPRNIVLAGNMPIPYESPTPLIPTSTPEVANSPTATPQYTNTPTMTPTPSPTSTTTSTPNCGPPGPLELVENSVFVCGAGKNIVSFRIRNTAPSTYVVLTHMKITWYDSCCADNDWDDLDKPILTRIYGGPDFYDCGSMIDEIWAMEGECSNPDGPLHSPAEVDFTTYCNWPILQYVDQQYTFCYMEFDGNSRGKKRMFCTNFKVDITFDCVGGSIDEHRTLFFTTPDRLNREPTFIFDPFTDGEDDTNPTWYSSEPENWGVLNDGGPAYSGQDLNDGSLSIVGDPTWADYTVEVEAKLIENYVEANPSQARSYIVFRYHDPMNYYYMQVRNGLLMLGCVVDGSFYVSASDYIAIYNNVWYRYKVVLEGDLITGYVFDGDGNYLIRQISYTDNSVNLQPDGYVGLRVNASMIRYDNFRVSNCSLY